MVQDILKRSAKQAIAAIQLLETEAALVFMRNVAHLLADTFHSGKKVIIAGNGGSLCDAAHFAEELTGVFRIPRPALPVIVLNEPGYLSCVGNDLGFDRVFARGVEAFGQPQDVFIGLTTSGNSINIVQAFETAQKKQLTTVAFLGKDGGTLAGVANYEWIVQGFAYSDRIQEVHMAAMHLIIEALEHLLFPQPVQFKDLETISPKIKISQYMD